MHSTMLHKYQCRVMYQYRHPIFCLHLTCTKALMQTPFLETLALTDTTIYACELAAAGYYMKTVTGRTALWWLHVVTDIVCCTN